MWPSPSITRMALSFAGAACYRPSPSPTASLALQRSASALNRRSRRRGCGRRAAAGDKQPALRNGGRPAPPCRSGTPLWSQEARCPYRSRPLYRPIDRRPRCRQLLVDLLARGPGVLARLPVAALDGARRLRRHLVRPRAERVAEPGLVELQRPEAQLVPALAGPFHVLATRQREGRISPFARRVDEQRRCLQLVELGRAAVGGRHQRGVERELRRADDPRVAVRL